MSLITQLVHLHRNIDLDSQPEPLLKLISLITLVNSVDSEPEFRSLTVQIFKLEPRPELISLINEIFSVVIFIKSESEKTPEKRISLSPQVEVKFEKGKFRVIGKVLHNNSTSKRKCSREDWYEDYNYFCCPSCNGKFHQDCQQAPVEIKHSFHPRHYLQLVMDLGWTTRARECYCCDEDLPKIFYYCSSGDFAMNIACVAKPPLLSAIDHPKWHEHTLALFPRQASLTCNVCALAPSSSPMYMCPPCDFVVHLKCINLPCVIRISRHVHRISFTPSFDQGDWSCGVCRRKIDNDYEGYSCIKDGCFYAAHSKCATQSNVWDGKELEGEPEDVEEEEFYLYVTISDGIIQHFSHQHHYLRLDENKERDYDENKEC